ncbi:uncharacterized protein [Euwallacea fornicatus]|uniref:uncharacterized protein n=1 Tax=Euwallacea fornicatus TaxID=995702 RepID=UPI00339003EF
MHCKYCIFLFFICHTSGFMDTDLVLSFIRTKSLKHIVVLTCNSRETMVHLQRELSTNQNMLFTVKNLKNLNIPENLVANYRRMGVVLDGDCDHMEQFFISCKRYKVFDTKHFWLVLFGSSSYRDLLKNAPLNINSEVKVAYQKSATPGEYFIDDVYNPAFGKGGQLRLSKVGFYGRDGGYQVKETGNKYVVRRNLTGVQFDILVVLNEPYQEPLLEYLKYNDTNIQIDTLGRFHARLLCYCEEYYNYSVRIAGVSNSWGYYQPDGTMDGLVGALQRHQVDFGSSPLVAKIERVRLISYGKGTWHLRMAFILRNPNAKKAYKIFIKPFSWGVWLCVIATSVLGLLAQKCSYNLDRLVTNIRKIGEDASWSFTALCIFGTLCQQGITAVPRCLSGRTSGFILLWLGALIYQFYSAALVSFLLNVPVTILSSIKDILESDFNIGYENVKYAKSILQQATNNLAKEVCRRVSTGNDSGFLSRDEGLNLVKKGHYAFHVELVTGYPFINKNFELSMICELREIPLFPKMFMYSGYQKGSPFKDLIDVCLQRFEEYGITSRELYFWHPKKPECMRTPSMIVINTSLEDFYPALAILLIGVIISFQVLVVEVLWKNRKIRKDKMFEFTEHKMSNILYFLLCWVSTVRAFIDESLILSFLQTKRLSHNLILTCYEERDQVQLFRNLTLTTPMITSVKHINKVSVFEDLVINYKRTGIVLDGDCHAAHKFLKKCRKYKVFDTKHFWLILHKPGNYSYLFEDVELNVDSEVKVAHCSHKQVPNKEIKYLINDVYNQAYGKGGQLKTYEMGYYSTQEKYVITEKMNKYFVRRNLTGVHFNSAIVLAEPFEGTLGDYLVDDRNAEVNTLNRFHARLMESCRQYYNYSVTITVIKSWGISKSDGTMDGLVGALERKVVDFGSTPLIVKKERRKFMSYGKNTWPLRNAFLFRNPNSKKSYQFFMKPLAPEIWICIVGSSILLTMAQHLSYNLNRNYLHSNKFMDESTSRENYWSLSVISTFGAFCQQGIVSLPNSMSGRILMIITLFLGLLVYQFYSAIFVSFLFNVPETAINTVQDILDSGFNIGFENISYVTALLRESNTETARKILGKVSESNNSGFITREVGLNLTEKGHYAFHVELATSYIFIEKHFDNSMICELKAVPLFSPMFMHANYQKWSPFKDILDVGLQRLSENGVVSRELIFWKRKKPICIRSSLMINIHTSIEDFYPALVVLFFGIVSSLQVLLLEILWRSRCNRKKVGVQKNLFPYTK